MGTCNKRTVLFLTLSLALTLYSNGQVSVTFRMNLDSLIKNGLFNPGLGHRVFIRGSFNNWEGTAYELHRQPSGNIYQGCFDMAGAPGDTVIYKYVIEKKPGNFFWEDNPDPANPDHGNRRLVLENGKMILPPATFHHNEYFSYPVIFSKKKLQEDFLQFRNILENTHPALYDYTEKDLLDSIFDSNYTRIDTALDFRSFLILMTEVMAKVGCGHSSLWIPGSYWMVTPEKLFPLKLHITGVKMYVTGSYAESREIPVGSELLSINGVPVASIIIRLQSLTSADGFNQSFRQARVARDFSVKYAMAYGFPNVFLVEYLSPDTGQKLQESLTPVSRRMVDQGNPDLTELSLKEMPEASAALLTINTFAYYSRVDMFHNFIDSVFRVIDQKGVENLVLDLRGNSGGDPFCASYLWAYLEQEPLPYFEDHYGKYDTLANPVPLPANHFGGKLFTLIDGNGFSTTGHFCGLLKYHRVGKFVGTELGATYTCTGNTTYPPLDHTGIMVGTARVMRYNAAVGNMDLMHGIIPDYPVELSRQDIISNRDAVLEYALELAGVL
jgi:hypothetical protein